MTSKAIEQHLQHRILILDGAMGTMIQQKGFGEKDYRGSRFENHELALMGCNDLLVLTQPERIAEIHHAYLDAGADIIESNSFNANAISLADYGVESLVYEINHAAAALARRCADHYTQLNPEKPRWVAGSMGPTNRSLSLSPKIEDPAFRSIDYPNLEQMYQQQAEALIQGGVDLLLVETIFDSLNAKAALSGIDKAFDALGKRLPIMVSITLEKSGRNLSGQSIEALVATLTHLPILSIGLNCSFGAKQILPYLQTLSSIAPCHVSVHPNAGMPNELGQYQETPETMAEHVKSIFAKQLVNIIGGCCGTTPAHIRAMAELAPSYQGRSLPKPSTTTCLAGMDVLHIRKESNFVNIGEQNNVAGSRKFARLIKEKNYDEAILMARKQIENGAQILDICMDEAMIDAQTEMVHFIRLLTAETDIARVPLMIDSSQFEVLVSGIGSTLGKPIVNSLSLKEGEDIFIQRAQTIRRLGAAMVVMLFDETGQAVDFQHKINIAQRAYHILVDQIGFPPQDIVFDLNILSIGTGIAEHNRYALDFIEACSWIKAHLPYCKISGGISNLSFAFRGQELVRSALHSVFLYHAIHAGLDMGIVNAGKIENYDQLEADLREAAEDLVLNRRADATDRLLEIASRIERTVSGSEQAIQAWRDLDAEARLEYGLSNGTSEFLQEDLDVLLDTYKDPLIVIEQPLMQAMTRIGQRFSEGKLFLPQIVKSARIMNQAVGYLKPMIEQNQQLKTPEHKVLIATVKGDVHDIGKNIAGVVVACNGFDIIDLGVMVPCQDILDRAISENVSIIGLSALITPSLEEMARVAQACQEAGLHIPIVVSGASTSELHTAVHLNPLYPNAGVFHANDASDGARLIQQLCGAEAKTFIAQKQTHYAAIKQQHLEQANKRVAIPLEQARLRRPLFDFSHAFKPAQLGPQDLLNYPIQQLVPYINWTYFFYSWDLPGEQLGKLSSAARLLFNDALAILERMVKEQAITAHAVYGMFPAHSQDESLIIEDQGKEYCFEMPRNTHPGSEYSESLADHLPPKEDPTQAYIGAFACSCGFGVDAYADTFEQQGDRYGALLVKSLADRLAEAFAEHLHERIRKEFWGFAANENLSIDKLFEQRYQGLRAAIGYPACPKHQLKQPLFELLMAEPITGIRLSESFMMIPAASTCGLIFER